MRTMDLQLAAAGLLFLATLATGIWLSHSGKPLNTGIFTLHKLIALSTVILIAVTVYNGQKTAGLQTVLQAGSAVVTGLLFLSLFISGALLSLDKAFPEAAHTVHRAAPYLAGLFSALTISLLLYGSSSIEKITH